MEYKITLNVILLLSIIYVYNCENIAKQKNVLQSPRNNTFNCTNETNIVLQNITNTRCRCCQGAEYPRISCMVNETFGQTLETLHDYGYSTTKQLVLTFLGSNGQKAVTKFDIKAIVNYTELLELHILKGRDYTGRIQFTFDNITFYGCKKLKNLRINVPLADKNLSRAITPLVNLKTLDLSDVRYLGWKRLLQTTQNLTINVEKLIYRSFQVAYNFGYNGDLYLLPLLNGKTHKKITALDFSSNDFQVVSKGWFKYVPNLVFLNISNNKLTQTPDLPLYLEMLMHTKLQIFLAQNQINIYGRNNAPRYATPYGIDQKQRDVSAETLIHSKIPAGGIQCIDRYSFGNISRLFNKMYDPFCNVMRNCIYSYTSPVKLSCERFWPSLYTILDYSCEYWIKFPLSPELREVNLNNIQVHPISSNLSFMYGNSLCVVPNRLNRLFLANNPTWWTAYGALLTAIMNNRVSVRGLDSLEEVDLSGNYISFKIDDSKIGFPALKHLNLSGNSITSISPNTSFCSSKSLSNLTVLDLSASLRDVTTGQSSYVNIIKHCGDMKQLYLSQNHIDSSFQINLEGVYDLQLIDLSSNTINVISVEFARILDETPDSRNLTLDLSNNPLTCDCSPGSLAFIKWLRNSKGSRIKDFASLNCTGDDGMRPLYSVDYITLWFECRHIQPIMITVLCSITVGVTIAVGMVTYRRRFRLQYSCFKCQQRISRKCRSGSMKDDDACPIYAYDAFVSYSSDDRFWVHDVLVKTLEDEHGFKLVIHYRDIGLGQNIQRAIDELMSKSREFILIISDNFLESDWCQLEMEEAYRQSLRRHGKIAIIILGEVPQNIRNPTARVILDNYNYLQWKDETENGDKDNKKLFWAKLVDHLYGNSGSCCNCCCLPFGAKALGYREITDFAKQYDASEDEPINDSGSQLGESLGFENNSSEVCDE